MFQTEYVPFGEISVRLRAWYVVIEVANILYQATLWNLLHDGFSAVG